MLFSHEPGQSAQVVRGAAEDEQPILLPQPSQLYLPQRAALLQPSEALSHQPSAAQADGIAGLPRSSPVQVTAAILVVLCHVRRHIQLPRRTNETLAVVSLGRAYSNAARAALLLFLQYQQSRIPFGIPIGMRYHRGRDQAVAVLRQCMAQITQLRLLAIALLVQPCIGVGGRFMGLVAALLTTKIRAIAVIFSIFPANAVL